MHQGKVGSTRTKLPDLFVVAHRRQRLYKDRDEDSQWAAFGFQALATYACAFRGTVCVFQQVGCLHTAGEAAKGQVEGPRSTSMHPILLTQLLGKVGEAWLTHAKANNLPKFVGASCAELVHLGGQLLERGGNSTL